jgi:acyl carrier protein
MTEGGRMTDRNNEILEGIKEHLGGRGIDTTAIVPEARITEDLDLDSLDVAELTLGLEERFSIEIPDEEAEDLRTVGDVVALIEKKVSVGA